MVKPMHATPYAFLIAYAASTTTSARMGEQFRHAPILCSMQTRSQNGYGMTTFPGIFLAISSTV
jgi:hypothetical protein